jgi:hypothetical protein
LLSLRPRRSSPRRRGAVMHIKKRHLKHIKGVWRQKRSSIPFIQSSKLIFLAHKRIGMKILINVFLDEHD